MSENAIVIRNLHKFYRRGKPVVNGLDMTVPKGAVYALLGNNGVGKTTTIRMMAGQLAPCSGTVSVLGLEPIKNGVGLKRHMAYVAENQRLYDGMTVDELIAFTRTFYPGWNVTVEEHLLKTFDLPRRVPIRDFSRGMYTKAALLSALCREPELLLLDDPTLGLDTTSRREFMRGIVDAIREFERTVIFSTHIIPEIEGLVDQVGIMVDGKLKVEASLDGLKTSFREIRLPYRNDAPLPPVPGLVAHKIAGDELVMTVKASEAEIAATGILPPAQRPMNLEEIFLAVV